MIARGCDAAEMHQNTVRCSSVETVAGAIGYITPRALHKARTP